MSVFSNITEALAIFAQLEIVKAQIKAARPGTVVDAGVARGVKLFGRKIDLPLQPLVRE